MIESKVFPKIYNNSNYILKKIPEYHPESIAYRNFWKTQIIRVFDGCWIPDSKGINIDLMGNLDYEELLKTSGSTWRWIPPQLYFYINFGTILHKPENAPKTSPKQKIRPYLSDFELAFFYNWIEARGFSGFEDDEEFSCNRDLYDYSKNNDIELHKSCYKKDGTIKTYIPARDYLRQLKDKPLGYALYENEAKNLILVATRRGGKSWSTAVGVGLHEIITDGLKYFDVTKLKNPPLNEVFVGSGMASKSSELCQKIQIGMENIPGTWHKGLPDEVPSPLYKHMAGTLQPNNIKSPWRHEYQKKVAGEWKNYGSGSNIKHGIFTQENPEVTAGGSYSVIVIEEVGLTQNLLIALGSSEATQVVDGTSKFGSTLMIGCVCAGTKIWTNNGKLINIEDLKKEDGILGYDGNNIIPQNINWLKEPVLKPCYKITTVGGNITKCSYDHPFLINNKKTSYNAKPVKFETAKNLSVGDKICIASEIPIFGNNVIDDSYLIGLLIGDGYYGGTTPSLSCNDEVIYNYLAEHYKFKIKKEFTQKNGTIYRELSLSYNNLLNRLKDVGIYKQTKFNKRLPINIHTFNRSSLANLLAGYFDADGNVSLIGNGRIVYTSIVPELLEEVKYQLLKFGIHSNISKEKRNTIPDAKYNGQSPYIYRLYISRRPDILKFKENIPIKSKHKIDNINKILLVSCNRTFGCLGSEDFIYNPNNKKGEYFIGKKMNNLMFESIKSIEYIGEQVVYNMNCGDTHVYLANNQIVGNTGGSVEKVVETEIVFRDPAGFNCLEFDDEWEGTGKIGWFVPAYYMDRSYKDEEGNTIIEKAYEHYEKRRATKKKARSGSALDLELMNFPLIPSEMFLNKTNNKFPIHDLKQTLSKLLTDDKLLAASWKGFFSINSDSGKIEWTNTDNIPIREFPLRNKDNIEGCWEIFSMPPLDNEEFLPYGRFIASMDPIDDDSNDNVKRSLQSTFIFDTWTDRLVAEYTGRTKFAKDYYEQVRRGLLFYNARLLYENQKKGLFTYFDQKNSLYLLEDTPEMLKDVDMQKISTVGNRSKGVYATVPIINWGIDLYAQYLMSQATGKEDGITNAHIIRSIGLLRESIIYSKDINTDRISSMIILMIFRETKIKYTEKRKAQSTPKENTLDKFMSRHFGAKGYNSNKLF